MRGHNETILGIGVDNVKIARFEGMAPSLRVYTPTERAYLSKKSHASAAGIFAAKEAVVKAMGTGFMGFWPNQVEIVHDALGKPGVLLHGEAARVADKLVQGETAHKPNRGRARRTHGLWQRGRRYRHGYSIFLSISHTSDEAVAFVVIQLSQR